MRFVERAPTNLGGNRFRFLNRVQDVSADEFAQRKGTLLWDYNFHYFDGLHATEPGPADKLDWVLTWIRSVPPGSRPAWDPYPTSRRILNWTKWVLSSREAMPDAVLNSLAVQVRCLERTLEYHLLGNHLLANAVALTMAGALFGGEEGDGWLKRGGRLLRSQLEEQFLADGAHFELSPVYHSAILEDLLDLIQVCRRTGVEPPPGTDVLAAKACSWLLRMTRPDGRVPLFNDSSYGIAPSTSQLVQYVDELGLGPVTSARQGIEHLAASGYFRYQSGRACLLGDVGQVGPSYQPGHAHCDMLNFELCWEARPIVVDSGTSTYQLGPRRDTERSTSAHNTVQMGRLEQSEVWAGFRVARRARIECVQVRENGVIARIRAFPPRWSTVERTWRFQGESIDIADVVTEPRGEKERWTARLHFHPDVRLSGSGDAWTADGLELLFEGATKVEKSEYDYAPEFNRRVRASCLEIEFSERLRTVFQP